MFGLLQVKQDPLDLLDSRVHQDKTEQMACLDYVAMMGHQVNQARQDNQDVMV